MVAAVRTTRMTSGRFLTSSTVQHTSVGPTRCEPIGCCQSPWGWIGVKVCPGLCCGAVEGGKFHLLPSLVLIVDLNSVAVETIHESSSHFDGIEYEASRILCVCMCVCFFIVVTTTVETWCFRPLLDHRQLTQRRSLDLFEPWTLTLWDTTLSRVTSPSERCPEKGLASAWKKNSIGD